MLPQGESPLPSSHLLPSPLLFFFSLFRFRFPLSFFLPVFFSFIPLLILSLFSFLHLFSLSSPSHFLLTSFLSFPPYFPLSFPPISLFHFLLTSSLPWFWSPFTLYFLHALLSFPSSFLLSSSLVSSFLPLSLYLSSFLPPLFTYTRLHFYDSRAS